MSEGSNSEIAQRRARLDEYRNQGLNPFANKFVASATTEMVHNAHADHDAATLATLEDRYRIAGRIMAKRDFGKAAFIQIQDRSGRLQVYVAKNQLGEEDFELFRKLDLGDVVGLSGCPFRTKTDELSLRAESIQLLTKSLLPLPEKWHGLTDVETRYRQRYLDLMVNPDVREVFRKRSRVITLIRDYMVARDYLEVETPMMQPIPGGAEAEPFVTHHNALGVDLYLRIAPELYLKRLVIGGLERVFEINRSFRNEGISTQHNPEFTMLEFYQAYATFTDLMDLTEQLFSAVSRAVIGSTTISYQGDPIELAGPWRRLTLRKALVDIGGIEVALLKDKDALLKFAAQSGIQITKTSRLGKIITKLFDSLVEPKLIQPTFITGYPVEVSPLSRRSEQEPEITDRFELFIGGREIANGFSELNDPLDQRERFSQQVESRRAGDESAHLMDNDYIEALEYGLPPTAGEGIGIDRLVMLLTDAGSIREVILFPHMKPRD